MVDTIVRAKVWGFQTQQRVITIAGIKDQLIEAGADVFDVI